MSAPTSTENVIRVVFVDAFTDKTRTNFVNRNATFADLKALWPGNITLQFTVDGCTPSGTAVIGDMYDACGARGALELTITREKAMGCGCKPDEGKLVDEYLTQNGLK